jgi:hypothetical protein
MYTRLLRQPVGRCLLKNFVKNHRNLAYPDPGTPAMAAGLTDRI